MILKMFMILFSNLNTIMVEKLLSIEEAGNMLGLKTRNGRCHRLEKYCDPVFCKETNRKPIPHYFSGSRKKFSFSVIKKIKDLWISA
jgi:hypothetical protein